MQKLSQSDGRRLDELDECNLMAVLDWLDFDELLNLAEANHHFHQIIADRYIIGKYKLHEKQLLFTGSSDASANITIYPNKLSIHNHLIGMQLLRNFGNLIANIRIDRLYFNNIAAKTLAEDINEFCSKTLKTLHIIDSDGLIISRFWRPFESLENVIISDLHMEDELRLDEIFPNLRSLDFILHESKPMSSIERHYPHLKYLRCRIGRMDDIDSQYFENLLRLNRRLRSVYLERVGNIHLLNSVNTILPDLTSLGLSIHPSDELIPADQFIHFENVRNFTLRIYRRIDAIFSPFPLKFNILDAVQLEIHQPSEQLLNALFAHSELKKIAMLWTDVDICMTFLDRIESFPKLEEIQLKWSSTIDTSLALEKFLLNNDSIQRITIALSKASDREQLIQLTSHAWTFVDENEIPTQKLVILSFERIKFNYWK